MTFLNTNCQDLTPFQHSRPTLPVPCLLFYIPLFVHPRTLDLEHQHHEVIKLSHHQLAHHQPINNTITPISIRSMGRLRHQLPPAVTSPPAGSSPPTHDTAGPPSGVSHQMQSGASSSKITTPSTESSDSDPIATSSSFSHSTAPPPKLPGDARKKTSDY